MADLVRVLLIALASYPLIFLILFPGLWWAHRVLKRPFGLKRAMILYLFGLSVYGPLLLTNLPLPDNFAAFCAEEGALIDPHFRPFQFFAPAKYFLAVLVREGRVLIIPFLIESFLNLWMLVPAGMLFRVLKKRNFAFPVLVGVASSLVLELTQLTGLWGWAPCAYRQFDVDDIILNATGFVSGWIFVSIVMALHRKFGSSKS